MQQIDIPRAFWPPERLTFEVYFVRTRPRREEDTYTAFTNLALVTVFEDLEVAD